MTVTSDHPTRRAALALSACGIAALAWSRPAAAAIEQRPDLEALFRDAGLVGTLVVHDVAGDRTTLIGAARAATRFLPASTFKIANSLIALETGVVADENQILPYGGKPQAMKVWEKDMSMREAIRISNVPIYQELARRIGLARYRDWLARLDYGNREVGTHVERFWLAGPLAISAIEQAAFVGKLAERRLDASDRSQAIVRDILRLEDTDGVALFAKTGWSPAIEPSIGWWTGWVEREGRIHAFSMNVAGSPMTDGAKRLALGRALLTRLGLLRG